MNTRRITRIKQKVNKKINRGRKNETMHDGTNFIKHVMGRKNHTKYRKIQAEKVDENYLVGVRTQNIYAH